MPILCTDLFCNGMKICINKYKFSQAFQWKKYHFDAKWQTSRNCGSGRQDKLPSLRGNKVTQIVIHKSFFTHFWVPITFVADIYIPHTTIKSFFFKYLAEKIPFVNKRFVVYLHILNDVALPSSLCSMIHFSCLKLYWDLWSLFM